MINKNRLFNELVHSDYCVVYFLQILDIKPGYIGLGNSSTICSSKGCGECWGKAFESIKGFMNGIQLKNINLDGITDREEIDKLDEEVDELKAAFFKRDVTNAVEEGFDVMQVVVGLLQKMGLDADYVMSQYDKHLEKIQSRPR